MGNAENFPSALSNARSLAESTFTTLAAMVPALVLDKFYSTNLTPDLMSPKYAIYAVRVQPKTSGGSSVSSMPRRRIEFPWFVMDTNRINAQGILPNMCRIQQWSDDRVIGLVISNIAFDEVGKGGRGYQRHNKACGYIITGTDVAEGGLKLLKDIQNILFPAGVVNQNQDNDVQIVFNAHKSSDVLITADTDILKKREELAGIGISRIKTDAEALKYIQQLIQSRDELAKLVGGLSGEDLPLWVGRD